MSSREQKFLNCYNKIIESIEFGAFHPATMEYAQSIYHYTNIPAFKSIVDSQSLWATDFRFLNDIEEFVYVYDVLEQTLSLTSYQDDGFERFKDALLQRCATVYFEDSFDPDYTSIKAENYYVICFSKSADNLTLGLNFLNRDAALNSIGWI